MQGAPDPHALLAAAKAYAQASSSLCDFIFAVSFDYVITDCIKQTTEKAYLQPDQFLGKKMQDVFPPELAAYFIKSVDTAKEVGQCIFRYELLGAPWEAKAVRRADDLVIFIKDCQPLYDAERLLRGPDLPAAILPSGDLPLKRRIPEEFAIPTEKRHLSSAAVAALASPPQVSVPIPVHPRVKLLFINSQPLLHEGEPPADLDRCNEKECMQRALALAVVGVDMHVVTYATRDNFVNSVNNGWNIVHVSAHGHSDGSLLLEDGSGGSDVVPGVQSVAELFIRAKNKAPLVVLSACFSVSMGEELIKTPETGVQAVVASTEAILAQATAVFFEHFYGMLAKGCTVGQAFESAVGTVRFSPAVGDSMYATERKYHLQDEDDWKGSAPWSKRFRLLGNSELVVPFPKGDVNLTFFPDRSQVESNLPPCTPNFIGRSREMSDMIRLFLQPECRVLSLTGPPGIGKTELARAVAWWLLDRGHMQIFLWESANKQDIDTLHFPYSTVSGGNEESWKNEMERFHRLAARGKPMVVLTDRWDAYARDKGPYMKFVEEAPRHIKWIITSRDKVAYLPLDYMVSMEVGCVRSIDARRLFWNTLGNANFFRNRATVTHAETLILRTIADVLGCYPLAIVLAASQARVQTLEEIVENFRQCPKRILNCLHDVARQPWGLWPALEETYSELDPLCRHEGFVVDDIAAVLNIDIPAAQQSINTLIRRSMIRRGASPGKLTVHTVIRQFGRAKLAESDVKVLDLGRTIVSYLLKERRDALVQACTSFISLNLLAPSDAMKDMLPLSEGLYEFASLVNVVKSHSGAMLELGEGMIALCARARCQQRSCRSLIATSELSWQIRHPSDAARMLSDAAAQASAVNNKTEIIRAANTHAWLLLSRDRTSEATTALESAFSIASAEVGTTQPELCAAIAWHYCLKALISQTVDHDLYASSFALFHRAGLLFAEPLSKCHLQVGAGGAISCSCADTSDHFTSMNGAEFEAQAQLLHHVFEMRRHHALTLGFAADCQHRAGHMEQVELRYEQSLRELVEIGCLMDASDVVSLRIYAAMETGDYANAKRWLAQSLTFIHQAGDDPSRLGRAMLFQGKLQKVDYLYKEAQVSLQNAIVLLSRNQGDAAFMDEAAMLLGDLVDQESVDQPLVQGSSLSLPPDDEEIYLQNYCSHFLAPSNTKVDLAVLRTSSHGNNDCTTYTTITGSNSTSEAAALTTAVPSVQRRGRRSSRIDMNNLED